MTVADAEGATYASSCPLTLSAAASGSTRFAGIILTINATIQAAFR
jgi:hypothetical protein